MSWVDTVKRRIEARRLLLVVRADALDAGWLARRVAGAPPVWRSLSVPIAAAGTARDATPLLQALQTLQAQLADAALGPPAGVQRDLLVLIGAPWLTASALPWSDALLQADSAELHARSVLAARGQAPAPADMLRIASHPRYGAPRSVDVLPRVVIDALRELASALQARRCRIEALDAAAARYGARCSDAKPRLIGVASGAMLRLLARDGTAPPPGQSLVDDRPVQPMAARAQQLWQRARLRFPALAAASPLPVLALDEPPPEVAHTMSADPLLRWIPWPGDGRDRSALDRALAGHLRSRGFDADPSYRAPWQRGWPYATAALLTLALIFCVHGWQQWRAAAPLALAVERPDASRREAPPSKAQLAEMQAVNAAVRQLNLPLAAVMRALQPPRDIAVILSSVDLSSSMTADPDAAATHGASTASPSAAIPAAPAGTIRLTAQAGSGQDMTRYVTFLGGRKGIASAQLLRHEIDTKAPGERYEFVVELAWRS